MARHPWYGCVIDLLIDSFEFAQNLRFKVSTSLYDHLSYQLVPTTYSNYLFMLTDGLRIYCGKASKRLRKASSAPALFILV